MRYLILFFLLFSSLQASPQFKKRTSNQYFPYLSVGQHYALGEELFQQEKWKEAKAHLHSVVEYFPEFKFYNKAVFDLGCAYYSLGEFDRANTYFSKYLELKGDLPSFEDALQLRFKIAEMLRTNPHRKLCARKWGSGFFGDKDKAMQIYDEVIAALSNKEIAIEALFQKGMILKKKKEFEESIDVFKTLAHRYEVHSLAEQSYLQISEVYLARALRESQNPDLLDLAQLNIVAFQKAFPTSPLREELQKNLVIMKEEFGKSLYRTGCFYEKKGKYQAAKIYFTELLTKFPDTEIAISCRKKFSIAS